jgi:hypothetical protein
VGQSARAMLEEYARQQLSASTRALWKFTRLWKPTQVKPATS